MEKNTNTAAKVFAILFSILLVLSAIGSLLMITFVNQSLDPVLYEKALSESKLYERLPQLIGEQIVFSVNRNPCLSDPSTCTDAQLGSTPAYLSSIDATEWAAVISRLVNPLWLKTQVDSVIDQVFNTLNTPGQSLSLDISLIELKARLGGEDGYQAALTLFNSLEPCTAKDALNLPSILMNAENPVGMPLCRPSEEVLKLGEDTLRATLKKLADSIPDDTSGFSSAQLGNLGTGLPTIQRTLQLARTIALLSPVIPLFLLLIITLLVVRSFKSFLKWWGIPLAVTGILTFISGLLITPVIRSLLLTRVNLLTGMAPGVLEMLKLIVLKIASSFRYSLLIEAVILFVIGLLMSIFAQLIHPKSRSTTTG